MFTSSQLTALRDLGAWPAWTVSAVNTTILLDNKSMPHWTAAWTEMVIPTGSWKQAAWRSDNQVCWWNLQCEMVGNAVASVSGSAAAGCRQHPNPKAASGHGASCWRLPNIEWYIWGRLNDSLHDGRWFMSSQQPTFYGRCRVRTILNQVVVMPGTTPSKLINNIHCRDWYSPLIIQYHINIYHSKMLCNWDLLIIFPCNDYYNKCHNWCSVRKIGILRCTETGMSMPAVMVKRDVRHYVRRHAAVVCLAEQGSVACSSANWRCARVQVNSGGKLQIFSINCYLNRLFTNQAGAN